MDLTIARPKSTNNQHPDNSSNKKKKKQSQPCYSPPGRMAKMAQVFSDLFYSLSNCLTCFPGSPTLKINSRSFKILRLLGEVGLCS